MFGRWRLGGVGCCECAEGEPCTDPECDPDDVASGPLYVTLEYDDTSTDTQPYFGGIAFFTCPNGDVFRVEFGCVGGVIKVAISDEVGGASLCGEAPGCDPGECLVITSITCPPLVVEIDASDCFLDGGLTHCGLGLLSITLHT